MSSPQNGCLEGDEYFMAVALLTSKCSKDPNTQVGACIVNNQKVIVGIGYNDMPKRCENLPWVKIEGTLEDKLLYVCHAELNAILNKNCASLEGSTIYVTHFPCNECAKLIIQSGIRVIYYLNDTKNTLNYKASKRMLMESKAEIKLEQMQLNHVKIDVIESEKEEGIMKKRPRN